MLPVPVQVIAKFDTQSLSSVPAYGKDPYFGKLTTPSVSDGLSCLKPKNRKFEREEVAAGVNMILRNILELDPSERLGPPFVLSPSDCDSLRHCRLCRINECPED